jgi:uncharacterized protein YdeI (YjbR/CyaY-like superfamily)
MKSGSQADPRFFATPAEFRRWLEKNHTKASELWVGMHKRHTGKPCMDWPQSVDCALCFGWIDGLRKSLGGESYLIRFTPRKSTSVWSAINIRKMAELTKAGLMTPAGLAVFENRSATRAHGYTYGNRTPFDAKTLAAFKAKKKAWTFFEAQPPGYQRLLAHWVMSAKREETRKSRLAKLVAECAAGRRLDQFTGKAKSQDNAKAKRATTLR